MLWKWFGKANFGATKNTNITPVHNSLKQPHLFLEMIRASSAASHDPDNPALKELMTGLLFSFLSPFLELNPENCPGGASVTEKGLGTKHEERTILFIGSWAEESTSGESSFFPNRNSRFCWEYRFIWLACRTKSILLNAWSFSNVFRPWTATWHVHFRNYLH